MTNSNKYYHYSVQLKQRMINAELIGSRQTQRIQREEATSSSRAVESVHRRRAWRMTKTTVVVREEG